MYVEYIIVKYRFKIGFGIKSFVFNLLQLGNVKEQGATFKNFLRT